MRGLLRGTHLADVDLAVLVVVVGLHEARLQLHQHVVGHGLRKKRSRDHRGLGGTTHFGTHVGGVGARHKLPQEPVQLRPLDVAVA